MGVTYAVREMTTADVAAVAELEARAFDDPWSPASFFEELSMLGRHYLVVEDDGHVVGYGGVMHVDDDAHIMTIAVDPPAANRRIGTRLMLALVEGAIERGARNMTLEVRVSNDAALALYRRFGFAAAGLRPRYYPTEDALVMWAIDVDGADYRRRLERIRESLA
ncbi:MAG: ribosomal-protein-alanine N-acetyltransferase [Actinobacteria bacterium RBG_16_68_21]|nr:MAG: ribosomal-protein-alanine N-acetyltransferase [Actinobacteria bacterium RBG_16_68_21]